MEPRKSAVRVEIEIAERKNKISGGPTRTHACSNCWKANPRPHPPPAAAAKPAVLPRPPPPKRAGLCPPSLPSPEATKRASSSDAWHPSFPSFLARKPSSHHRPFCPQTRLQPPSTSKELVARCHRGFPAPLQLYWYWTGVERRSIFIWGSFLLLELIHCLEKKKELIGGIGGWDYYIKFEGQLIKHTCNRPMTPKWSECPSNSYRELSSHENAECSSPLTEATSSSTSYVGLPAVNRMCSLSAENKDVNVYKRRKMDKDSIALVADEEVKEMATKSCTTADTTFSNLTAGKIDAVLEIEVLAGVSLEPNSGVNERCSVSTVPPSSVMLDKNAAAECSSSYMSPTDPITEITSARDLCIAILRKDGLLTESRTRITSEESTDCNANHLLACNTCGSLDDPLKMLICDSCEAAFHLSCCIPCIKEVPADEWYCPPCFRKKPKSLYGKLLEGKVKCSVIMDERPHGMSHIEYMLKDTEPYVSGVRIDRDLQAEVPEWSGLTFSSDGYFEAPSEFCPTEVVKLNWCSTNNHNRSSSSVGNWIQCREILSTRDSNKPVICGKWRRAPLYVVQSDKWDCSCCLPWDPAHADCAVPQELDTDEVLKQLKCVNMLKSMVADQNH